MTGFGLVIVFIIAIVAMILMISKLKIHPFISIMLVALAFGIIGGIPLVDTVGEDGAVTQGIANVIGAGFSSIFTSIGIVIILGALIGSVLEATGGAFKLADVVVNLVGKKHPELAMEIMGWVVSIPVFCDSGFVILNPIRKALVQRTAVSSVTMTVALACGLYVSHVFMPPTPGPIAAAGLFVSDDMGINMGNELLLVMGIGALASVLPLIAGLLYARYIGKHVKAGDEADPAIVQETYEEIKAAYPNMPNGALTFAPILVPIILMALGSIASMAGWSGVGAELCAFFGTPIIALSVGVLFSVFQLVASKKLDKFYDLCQDTLKVVGPILFITAAGGVLGRVIANTDMVNFITQQAELLQGLGIFFPFLLAAILKTAQGSSTVAITTTAGMVAPLMATLGFTTPIDAALAIAAIGAGAMTVSHANDSYFWVVTNFGSMNAEQGYRTQTVATGIMGVAGIIGIVIMSMIF